MPAPFTKTFLSAIDSLFKQNGLALSFSPNASLPATTFENINFNNDGPEWDGSLQFSHFSEYKNAEDMIAHFSRVSKMHNLLNHNKAAIIQAALPAILELTTIEVTGLETGGYIEDEGGSLFLGSKIEVHFMTPTVGI